MWGCERRTGQIQNNHNALEKKTDQGRKKNAHSSFNSGYLQDGKKRQANLQFGKEWANKSKRPTEKRFQKRLGKGKTP